jgi:predicted nucleotidyltransferase
MGIIIPNMKKKKISLCDSLFSKVRQRVLALFYNHPDRDFHTNEVIRLTESGTGAVQRELASLTATGIILSKDVGNQKRYQVNKSAPIYPELLGIVTKTFGLANHLKQALNPLASNIEIAFIFGSIAKREDTARSDIDILIIGTNISYSDIYKLTEHAEQQLGRKINPTCYSLSDWQRKARSENHFIKKITQQEKIFLIGSEDELNQLGQSR